MNGRILIVEDEPEVRDYLSIALKRQGYTTEVADDGDEAIDALTRPGSDVSLMLLDIIMPRKDGLDTLREVRQFKPLLPIVMLSGSCSTPHVIQAMKGGANDFLQKPVSFEDLGKAIEKALQSRSDAPFVARWCRPCKARGPSSPTGVKRSRSSSAMSASPMCPFC